MSERQAGRVGVRELRQNLSIYLDRVKEGESLTVTEHGAEVAQLVPMPRAGSSLERLVAEGRARPASGNLADLGMPPPFDGPPLSATLQALRDEEDR